MQTIKRQIQFDSAHMLSGYAGKCANLHGHTYTGEVTITGGLDQIGMVLDYNEVKRVIDEYDHATLFSSKLYRNAAEEQLLEWCVQNSMKYKVMKEHTTAEDMSRQIAEEIWSRYDVESVVVELHETPGSTAIGIAGDIA